MAVVTAEPFFIRKRISFYEYNLRLHVFGGTDLQEGQKHDFYSFSLNSAVEAMAWKKLDIAGAIPSKFSDIYIAFRGSIWALDSCL